MKGDNIKKATSGVPIPQFMLDKTLPKDLTKTRDDLTNISVVGKRKVTKKSSNISDEMRSLPCGNSRQPPFFSKTETEQLLAEGLPFPHGYPVTKAEEKALKKVRRRIKNKLSAQESRRRKKEYIEGLEKRIRSREKENAELRQKVEKTEEKLRSMVDELFALKQNQASTDQNKNEISSEKSQRRPVTITSVSRATQTGMCLQCYTGYYKNGHGNMEKQHLHSHPVSPPAHHPLENNLSESNTGKQGEIPVNEATTFYNEDYPVNSANGNISPEYSEKRFLYWQLMRTGETSPQYESPASSPTDSFMSDIS